LEKAGFGSEQCEALHGEQDAGRIDVTGEAHGWRGTLARKLQEATDEGEQTRRYAEYLRAGHYLLAVSVGEDDAAKKRAAEALHAADAQFVTYYAGDYIEDLGGSA
jgi:hypothetical protein